jgi:hypothetical protein
MTAHEIWNRKDAKAQRFIRHCEERSDAAIQGHPPSYWARGSGLLRCARNDGLTFQATR